MKRKIIWFGSGVAVTLVVFIIAVVISNINDEPLKHDNTDKDMALEK